MKAYTHYIGNFKADTLGLSMQEEGAYRRLLDLYYMTEKPLPLDLKVIHRAVSAMQKSDKIATQFILENYFYKTADGYVHNFADEVIAKSKAKGDKARESAKARWDKQDIHKQRNANAMRTQCAGDADSDRDNINPSTKGGIQNHLAPGQESPPESAPESESSEPNPETPATPVGLCCKAMIEGGIPPAHVSHSHPKLITLVEAGATPDEFLESAREAVGKGKASMSYVLAMIEGRRRDAKAMLGTIATGKVKPKPVEWWASDSATIDYGRTLGLNAKPGESMFEYRARLRAATPTEEAPAMGYG